MDDSAGSGGGKVFELLSFEFCGRVRIAVYCYGQEMVLIIQVFMINRVVWKLCFRKVAIGQSKLVKASIVGTCRFSVLFIPMIYPLLPLRLR